MASYNDEARRSRSIETITLDSDSDATVEEDWERVGIAAIRPGGSSVLVEPHREFMGHSQPGDGSGSTLLDDWDLVEAHLKVHSIPNTVYGNEGLQVCNRKQAIIS
jgi:hypothetical protein